MVIHHTGENKKTKCLKEPYPKNLLLTIQVTSVHEFELQTDNITDDMLAGLEYAISTLTEREKTILRMRYQERCSYREIGEAEGVTLERIRTLDDKLLRKLRVPKCLGCIKYGLRGYADLIDKKAAEEKKKEPEKMDMLLETLDLSVRCFNCLKVRGCDTVRDVARMTEEEIIKTKNLGRRSMIEIAEALHRIGVKDTAWDDFLPDE